MTSKAWCGNHHADLSKFFAEGWAYLCGGPSRRCARGYMTQSLYSWSYVQRGSILKCFLRELAHYNRDFPWGKSFFAFRQVWQGSIKCWANDHVVILFRIYNVIKPTRNDRWKHHFRYSLLMMRFFVVVHCFCSFFSFPLFLATAWTIKKTQNRSTMHDQMAKHYNNVPEVFFFRESYEWSMLNEDHAAHCRMPREIIILLNNRPRDPCSWGYLVREEKKGALPIFGAGWERRRFSSHTRTRKTSQLPGTIIPGITNKMRLFIFFIQNSYEQQCTRMFSTAAAILVLRAMLLSVCPGYATVHHELSVVRCGGGSVKPMYRHIPQCCEREGYIWLCPTEDTHEVKGPSFVVCGVQNRYIYLLFCKAPVPPCLITLSSDDSGRSRWVAHCGFFFFFFSLFVVSWF